MRAEGRILALTALKSKALAVAHYLEVPDVGDGRDLYGEAADRWVFAVTVAVGGGGERA